jgi:hypothetical protein
VLWETALNKRLRKNAIYKSSKKRSRLNGNTLKMIGEKERRMLTRFASGRNNVEFT